MHGQMASLEQYGRSCIPIAPDLFTVCDCREDEAAGQVVSDPAFRRRLQIATTSARAQPPTSEGYVHHAPPNSTCYGNSLHQGMKLHILSAKECDVMHVFMYALLSAARDSKLLSHDGLATFSRESSIAKSDCAALPMCMTNLNNTAENQHPACSPQLVQLNKLVWA